MIVKSKSKLGELGLGQQTVYKEKCCKHCNARSIHFDDGEDGRVELHTYGEFPELHLRKANWFEFMSLGAWKEFVREGNKLMNEFFENE